MVKNFSIRIPLFLILVLLSACSAAGNNTGEAEPPQTELTLTSTRVPTQPEPTVTSTRTPTQSATKLAAPITELQPVAGSYLFTEGPAADSQGNVHFSDINAGKIFKWSPDGQVSIFMEGLKGPNGLAFDKNGLLIACEGGNGRVIAIDPQKNITIVADQYNGKRFNEPNDLWIDSQNGIYFTDPTYQSTRVQPVEAVYYLAAGQSQVQRVIDDLTRPNGIVGTPDGKTLYVADHGAGQTFTYTINGPGQLSSKRLFAASGSDGMDLDATGNLYLTTTNKVLVYDPSGKKLREITVPQDPTNVTFTGQGRQNLFITARTAVYTLQMSEAGSSLSGATKTGTNLSSFTLTSPAIAEDGTLPVEYTCDGAASTLALTWGGAPLGTQGYAVIMHHEASPSDIHWYWVVYNIPADVTSLSKNMIGIGTLGNNSVNGKTAYTPPCSKGPGSKTYIYSVYALSAQPQLSVPANQVTRAVLLDAIRGITLASAEMHVSYSRK
jgi:gluconolactonase